MSLLAKVKLGTLASEGLGDVEVEVGLEPWGVVAVSEDAEADNNVLLLALRVSDDKDSLVKDCSTDITLVGHSSLELIVMNSAWNTQNYNVI